MKLKSVPIVMMILLSFAAFGEINPDNFEGLSHDQLIDRAFEDDLYTSQVKADDEKHPHFRCIARNWRGRRFLGRGYIVRRAARRALIRCRQRSYFPFTCRVVRCRRAF